MNDHLGQSRTIPYPMVRNLLDTEFNNPLANGDLLTFESGIWTNQTAAAVAPPSIIPYSSGVSALGGDEPGVFAQNGSVSGAFSAGSKLNSQINLIAHGSNFNPETSFVNTTPINTTGFIDYAWSSPVHVTLKQLNVVIPQVSIDIDVPVSGGNTITYSVSVYVESTPGSMVFNQSSLVVPFVLTASSTGPLVGSSAVFSVGVPAGCGVLVAGTWTSTTISALNAPNVTLNYLSGWHGGLTYIGA